MRLDPFKPMKPEDEKWMRNIIEGVHQNFISLVKERRPQLDVNHKTVFEADVFLGKDAVEIGLADRIASDLKAICQEKFGKDVRFQRCEMRGLFGKWAGQGIGSQAQLEIDNALDSIEIKHSEAKKGFW